MDKTKQNFAMRLKEAMQAAGFDPRPAVRAGGGPQHGVGLGRERRFQARRGDVGGGEPEGRRGEDAPEPAIGSCSQLTA